MRYYNALERFKHDVNWLASECATAHFAGTHLSSYQLETLQEPYDKCDNDSVVGLIEALLSASFVKLQPWTHKIEERMLPVLALVPEQGVVVVVECESDGRWRCSTPKGETRIVRFTDRTIFMPLRTEETHQEKISAKQMFIEGARAQKRVIIHAAIASLSINLLALGTSFYSMQVYDRVIPTQGMSTLMSLSIGVLIAIFLEMILKVSRSTLVDHASQSMDRIYSHDIFKRVLKIRVDAMPKNIGILSSQLQSYSSVRSFITSIALYVVVDFPFSIIFLTAIILLGGWVMGLIVLVFLIISIISGLFFRKKIESLSRTSSMSSHKKLGLLMETVENREYIKATGSGQSMLSRWNVLTENGIHDDVQMRHYSELSTYIASFLQQISYVVIVATGAYLVSTTDTLTMGGLIATTILSGRVLSPVAMIPNLLVQWGRAQMAVKDLDGVYALTKDNQGVARPLFPVHLKPQIECQNIVFSYGKDMPAMGVKSLTIKHGEKVAILGVVGSGKSTLLKMLGGLYAPQEGKVLLDNLDIQHISRNKLSEFVGYLPQSTKLISGTLRDNLLHGMLSVGDDEIMRACEKTGLIQLISSLPQGLDTPVPEGGESVSGGQKQIIAITRLILAHPNLWLLDEPTASMDDGNEARMIALFKNEIKGDDTMVLITHKPSLLAIVDRIIVMTSQGVAMDGPRDEILKKLTAPQGEKQ